MIFSLVELQAKLQELKVYHLSVMHVRDRWQAKIQWCRSELDVHGIGDSPSEAINLAVRRAEDVWQQKRQGRRPAQSEPR